MGTVKGKGVGVKTRFGSVVEEDQASCGRVPGREALKYGGAG